MLIQADESVENVVAGSSIVITALVIGEVVLHRADRQLLLKSIDLVEEQDDGGLDEPSRVADGVEQSQGLLHTVDGLIFEKQLIVLGDGDKEENGGDVLEAVNPLLTFGTLATHIEHAVGKISDDESCFSDTSGLDTGAKDVLVIRHIIGSSNASDVIEVTKHVLGQRKEKSTLSGVLVKLTILLSR